MMAQQAFSTMFTTGRAEPGHDLALTMLDSFVLIHSKPPSMEQILAAHHLLTTSLPCSTLPMRQCRIYCAIVSVTIY